MAKCAEKNPFKILHLKLPYLTTKVHHQPNPPSSCFLAQNQSVNADCVGQELVVGPLNSCGHIHAGARHLLSLESLVLLLAPLIPLCQMGFAPLLPSS